MIYNTIHSLGSRCQNSEILKHYGYREFSGYFDFMNTTYVKNIKHMLKDDFKELLNPDNNVSLVCNQTTIDPETGENLPTSIRTGNKFYNEDFNNVHTAIYPHHNLNSEKDYNHFVKCRDRFHKLKNYNTLFNYTYNKWENSITVGDMEEIVYILQDVYNFSNFKVCFIGIDYGSSNFTQTISSQFYDNWDLNITRGSFTGGRFSNLIDNKNYIDIIKTYSISDNRVSKNEIDLI